MTENDSSANIAAFSDQVLASGWITHGGGICPVDVETPVTYMVRMGWISDAPTKAGALRWDHGRTPESAADASLRRNDIIAYKPEPPDVR